MDFYSIEHLLQRTMGLSAETVGRNSVHRAIQADMGQAGCDTFEIYERLLNDKPARLQALIERVVVPETWFFRDAQPFALVSRLACAMRGRGRPIRVLSLPCATGEEPYSLAMVLLEAGLSPSEFTIEAIDISATALATAQRAVYGQNSFRGDDGARRDIWFRHKADGWHLDPRVREAVNFHEGNIMADGATAAFDRYDFIFCRNLLIYFDQPTQSAVTQRLKRLLAPEGAIFVGHAEAATMLKEGFSPWNEARSFAFAHTKASRVKKETAPQNPIGAKRMPVIAPVIPFSSVVLKPPVAVSTESSVDPLADAAKLADTGRLAEAEIRVNEVIARDGPTAAALYLLGITQDARGLSDQAEASYRKALYLDPKHAEVLAHLALIIAGRGDHAAARRLHQRARKQDEQGGAA